MQPPVNAPTPTPMPTPTPGIGLAPNYPPQPAPEPQPQLQPAPAPEPAPQPTPSPEPQPAPQPTEPQPQPNPTEPTPQVNPQPQPTTDPTRQQLTYDEYLESLTKNIPEPPKLPNPSEVKEDDPEALAKFFEDYGNAMEQRLIARQQQQVVVQQAEGTAWREVFAKYPEIEANPTLRDTVHRIRVGAYQNGESLSPIQVADALVGTLHNEYRKGTNDTLVQTRVQNSQPLNGGGQPPAVPAINYEALQQPGQAGTDAAVGQLEAMIRAGQI